MSSQYKRPYANVYGKHINILQPKEKLFHTKFQTSFLWLEWK